MWKVTEKDSNSGISLLVAIIIAVVTAVVTSALNHVVWKSQWQMQLQEKSFENRYALLKETALLCSRYQLAREQSLVYMLMLKGWTQDIPKTDIEKLQRIQHKLNNSEPELLSAYNESHKIFSELKAHIEIVRTFFGPKTKMALDEYVKATRKMPDEYIGEYVKQHRRELKKDNRGREYVDPEMKVFANKAEEEMNEALAKVLVAMREELGVPVTTP